MYFVRLQKTETVFVTQLLLTERLNVNARDTEWKTARYFAAELGNEFVAQSLLENGANPNV